MTSPIKSGVNSKQVTGALQFVCAPRNAHCNSGDHANRTPEVFIGEKVGNSPFAHSQHGQQSPTKPVDAEAAGSEKLSSAIFNAAPDSILAIGPNHAILSFNPAAEQTFGFTRCQALGQDFTEMLVAHGWHDAVRRAIEKFFSGTESGLTPYRTELQGRRANGLLFPAEVVLVPLDLQGERVCTVFIRDMSEKKRAEALQSGQNRILNLIAMGNPLQHILTEIANFAEQQSERALCSICRFNDDHGAWSEPVPHSPRSYYAAQIDGIAPAFLGSHNTSAYGTKLVHVEDSIRAAIATSERSDASRHSFMTYASWPISGKSRKIFGTLAFHFSEATTPTAHEDQVARICARLAGIAIERSASDEKVRYLAHYDGLTALPNRFLFNEYLSLALRNARRSGKKFALLFIDLDKFKEINDTLGHAAGDLVLQEIATRMRGCLRHSDKIARMGGDEFYVLAEDLNNGYHAADIAAKLLDAASRPVRIDGEEHHVSASIGISIYPHDGQDSQALLQNADCAMYRAKEMGKNRYHFFSTPRLRSNVAPPPINGHSRSTAMAKNN